MPCEHLEVKLCLKFCWIRWPCFYAGCQHTSYWARRCQTGSVGICCVLMLQLHAHPCNLCNLYNNSCSFFNWIIFCFVFCLFFYALPSVFVLAADFGVAAEISATAAKRKSFIGTPYWWAICTMIRIISSLQSIPNLFNCSRSCAAPVVTNAS